MAHSFPQKNRRSIRLSRHDYTKSGFYFITICTYKRQCWFGEIIQGKVRLNHLGFIVSELWKGCEKRFNYVTIDQFIVMPSHFHGILVIHNINDEHHLLSKGKFGKPIVGSLGTIIGAFKSAVSKSINQMRKTAKPPILQKNYYERIIRNEQELNNIRQYILNNPLKWESDRENLLNHFSVQPIELDLYF
ncbi:MAG: transposase [Cyanobacteria bacterium P01_G01_bin.49]